MKRPKVSCSLVILFLLSAILVATGCAKKVVKESDLGGAGAAEEQAMEKEGEFKKEVVTGEGAKTPKTEVSKAIEESLKGLETKEPRVTERPLQPTPDEKRLSALPEVGKEGEVGTRGGREGLTGLTREEMAALPKEERPGTEGLTREEMAALPKEERPGTEGLTREKMAALEKLDEVARLKGKLLPVYFDFDKYSIREDARDTLKNNAAWLIKHPSVKILLEGHADERGSNEYNLALGDRRALSVMNYLRDLGVNVEVSTVSFGEERPVCMESNEDCWAKNRRAEFKIVSD